MDDTKKALLSIDIDTTALAQNVANAKAAVADLTDKLTAMKAAGESNTEAFAKVSEQLKKAGDAADKSKTDFEAYTRGVSDSTKASMDLKAGMADLSKQHATLKDDTTKTGRSVSDYTNIMLKAVEGVTPFGKSIGETAEKFKAFKEGAGKVGDALGLFKTQGKTAADNAATLSTSAGNATRDFEALKTGTEAAGGGVNIFGKALSGLGIGLIIVAVSALIDYLKQFTPVVDACEQITAGLSGAFNALGRIVAGMILPMQELFTNPKKAMVDLFNFIEQNLINRFKALGVIIDGIAHHDFQQVTDGIIQMNIGVTNATGKMAAFGKTMADAYSQSVRLKSAQQELAKDIESESLRAAETEAKVAELHHKAQTANLADRKKYLQQIKDAEATQAAFHASIVNRGIDLAIDEAKIKHNLTDQEIADIKRLGAAELEKLEKSGRLFADDAKNISDALKKKYTDMEGLYKVHKTNMQGIKVSAQNLQTEFEDSVERTKLAAITNNRQRQIAELQADFTVRIKLVKGNNALIEQLQKEHTARLKELNDGFDQQDLEDKKTWFDMQQELKLKAAANDYRQTYKLKTEQNKQDLEYELANVNLTETQKLIIKEKYRRKQVEDHNIFYEEDSAAKSKNDNTSIAIIKKTTAEELSIINEKAKAYQAYFTKLATMFNKNTQLGKAAFIAQKALAAAEIAINTEKQVSSIFTGTRALVADDLKIPIVGEVKAAIDIAIGAAEVVGTIANGVKQAATINSTTPQGFARGGLYLSDGFGGFVAGPGSKTSDSINARLSNGEAIINARSTEMFAPILSAINQAGGGRPFNNTNNTNGFALGGLFNGSNSLNDGSTDLATTRNLDDMAKTLAANMPRQILVVEDVQAGLQNKAMLQNLSNF